MFGYGFVYHQISFFYGVSLALLLLGAQVAAITHLDPHIALMTFALANISYAMASNNVGRFGVKFANFAAICGFSIAVSSSVLSIFVMQDVSYWNATIWAFGSFMSQPLFRWCTQELANRHANIVDRSILSRKISQALELGFILPFAIVVADFWQPTPSVVLLLSAFFLLMATLLVIVNFSPRRRVELILSSKDPANVLDGQANFRKLLVATACLLFCIGTFRLLSEYAVRYHIKTMSNSFQENQKIIAFIYVLSGVGAFLINQTSSKKYQKSSPSSIAIGIAGFIGIGIIVLVIKNKIIGVFVSLAAIEIIARSLDRSVFSYVVQATSNTLCGRRKALFRYVQQGMNYILPAFVVFYIANEINPKIFFAAISTDFQITTTTIAGASILAIIFFSNRLDKFLRVMLSEGSKENTTRAILGLSMLRPRDFEVLMAGVLRDSPKKIVAKAAINALSSVNSESAIRLILDQFPNSREEIQLAVIQAVRGMKNPFAINFLWRASTGNVGSIAMKARFEATDAMSEIYGVSIIPMIMEGLKDDDARVVANTIDVLAQFYDARLVPTFFEFSNHPVARIQANALLALRKYAKSKHLWRAMVIDRFEKSPLNIQPSLLFVMGRSGDRDFCEYIRKTAAIYKAEDGSAIIERGFAIALVSLFDKVGYDLLFDILTRKNLNRDVEDAIVLFGGVNDEARMKAVEYLIDKHARASGKIKLFYSRLKASPLDLHFELELLKFALGPCVLYEVQEVESSKNVAA